MGKELYSLEVIQKIVEERNKGLRFREVADKINEEFGLEMGGGVAADIYQRVIRTASMPLEEGVLSPVDKSDVIQKLAINKAEKIEMIINQLEGIVQNMTAYKMKTMQWMDTLEGDLDSYYADAKSKGNLITISQINKIQDTIARTRSLIAADVDDYIKMIQMYLKMVELTKPTDIKINKLDISMMINNEITQIEKFGYFMINPKTQKAKDTLKSLVETGEMQIFSKT